MVQLLKCYQDTSYSMRYQREIWDQCAHAQLGRRRKNCRARLETRIDPRWSPNLRLTPSWKVCLFRCFTLTRCPFQCVYNPRILPYPIYSIKRWIQSVECGVYQRIYGRKKKLSATLQSTPSRQLWLYLSKKLRLCNLTSPATHADVTYWYQCANQKRSGSCNKRFFFFTCYKFE